MGRGLKYYFAPFATPANARVRVEGRRGKGSSYSASRLTIDKTFPYGNQNYEYVFCKASRGSPRLVRG